MGMQQEVGGLKMEEQEQNQQPLSKNPFIFLSYFDSAFQISAVHVHNLHVLQSLIL